MNPDDPIGELFGLKVMEKFKRVLQVHEALSQAFLERTGKVLEPTSEYTVDDIRRTSRILRSDGHARLAKKFLQLLPK
jgi:hypothetical protein